MNTLSKDAVTRVSVGEDGQGQRLDNYLTKVLKGVPKSHIYRIVRSGEVRVNRRRAEASTRLEVGDELRIPPIRTRESATAAPRAAPPGLTAPPVLYEDDALIVVDKPAGIAVHGGSGISFGVIERLRLTRPDARFLELVHRLDRETSGVLLVAKKRSALVALHAQLRDGHVDKRYLVLVRGRWRDAVRRVELPLLAIHSGRREARAGVARRAGRRDDHSVGSASGPISIRPWPCWKRNWRPAALIRSGCTSTHLGFPLAGDDKYGDFAWNKELARRGLKRMFLHARSIRFAHPVTGTQMAIDAPLATDLQAFLDGLEAGVRDDARHAS